MSERLLKLSDVCTRVGFGVTVIKEWEKHGDFPKPIRVNGSGHPRYLESEIDSWIEQQVKLNREVA